MSTLSVKPTTIEGIKSLAKDIRKRDGISHSDALDIAARQAGYANYQHARKEIIAAPTPSHFALISVPWRDRSTTTFGRECIKVLLPRSLEEILNFTQWKLAHGLAGMEQVSGYRLAFQIRVSSSDESLSVACASGRTLQFMAATGLRPSRAMKSKPKQPKGMYLRGDSRIPGIDHESTWYDPQTKTYVVLDEPYGPLTTSAQEERQAWASQHNWDVVKPRWPGMYRPELGTELYLMADKTKGFPLDRTVAALNALGPVLLPANCERISEPDEVN